MKKIVKNGNRYCPFCGHLLQRKGRYKFKPSHRWYCPKCHKYARFNNDQGRKRKNKLWLFKWLEYLTHTLREGQNMDVIAQLFEEILKYLKIRIFLFLNQMKDILLSI